MRDPEPGQVPSDERTMEAEIKRLNKIIRVLMDRAERSTSVSGTDFGLFQTAIMLEDQVRSRTGELETALREIEFINRALGESEARFRGIVSQSLVGIAILEGVRFSYANAKFGDIFGYRVEELQGIGLLDLSAESDRGVIDGLTRGAQWAEGFEYTCVFRALHRDGRILDIELHASEMQAGGTRVLIVLVVDVTERLRAEREVLALQEKLRELSVRDSLTGLYNRRFLEESLARELIAVERQGHPVSAIMADVDHFKAVNDQYGHQAGDEVLRAVAGHFARNARGSDICCRYGGEEFVVVLPQMDTSRAAERAELLRVAIEGAPVIFDATAIRVTASFGVATLSPGGKNGGDLLIGAADQALYAAKQAGRNRVAVDNNPAGK